MNDIDARIMRLEASNRRLRIGFVAIAVTFGFVVFSGADDKEKVPTMIRAESFSLVDKDGNGRGIWAAMGDSSMLMLGGKDDRHTYLSYSSKDGAALQLAHPDSSKQILAIVKRDGTVGMQVQDGKRVLWSAP